MAFYNHLRLLLLCGLKMLDRIICYFLRMFLCLLGFRWLVVYDENDYPDFGFTICGRRYIYYKWADSVISVATMERDVDDIMLSRPATHSDIRCTKPMEESWRGWITWDELMMWRHPLRDLCFYLGRFQWVMVRLTGSLVTPGRFTPGIRFLGITVLFKAYAWGRPDDNDSGDFMLRTPLALRKSEWCTLPKRGVTINGES